MGRAGRIEPGSTFSLREIAAERGVRLKTLRDLLDSSENERLFTLRGDIGVVAPLDLRVVRSLHQVRVSLQVDLVARSVELITPGELNRLELAAFSKPMGVAEHEDAIYDARRDLRLNLCRPAAAQWDMRVLRDLWDGAERYYRIGIDAVGGPVTEETAGRQVLMNDIIDQYREFMDRCRSRDARAVASSVRRNSEWAKTLAEESLEATG